MKLLRIEGVNLAHSIGDTEDLSTRRGGSLMLLDAIHEIAGKNQGRLKKISTGASAGLFEVTGDAKAALNSINAFLKTEPYCYGTFVVDHLETSTDFQKSENAALAANRWHQMQSLSFSPKGLAKANNGACTVDELRPATKEDTVKDKKQHISASVYGRREKGLNAKRKFYSDLLGSHFKDYKFTKDFEDIATDPVVSLEPKTLAGKIAVFYADGNKFGGIARDCKSADQLSKWDAYIKGQRAALLTNLLEHAASSTNRHWQKKTGELRLETLLWGGDEVMFVVPGWCGMELANLFFEQTHGLQYPEGPGGTKLTHAAGLVFCHQQAPISRISHLAKELAEKGKEANRTANSINWLVLESFDHVGSDLDGYLARHFNTPVKWSDLALTTASLTHMVNDFAKIKDKLPRSAIVHITRALAEARAFNSDGKMNDLVRRARLQVAEAGGNEFRSLWKHLHGKDWQDEPIGTDDLGAWVKLAELWDYCPDWNTNGPTTYQGEQA